MKKYTVVDKIQETPQVVTLYFVDENGQVPEFIPGQYINIYFPELNIPEGKAYSISSVPGEKTFSITIKAIGQFSNKLNSLQKGNTIQASSPYGFFSVDSLDTDLVLIAGGIGIAPFRSIIKSNLERGTDRNIYLFHSVKTKEDLVFYKEMRELQKTFSNLSLNYFVTREQNTGTNLGIKYCRMSAINIVNKIIDKEKAEFLICGSISFVREIWKALQKENISPDKICTEAFF